jgi:hypothetical protein
MVEAMSQTEFRETDPQTLVRRIAFDRILEIFKFHPLEQFFE